MGWWKINGPCGGIDWDAVPEAGGCLVNALPGQSTPENHYNGDQPADIAEEALGRLPKKWLKRLLDDGNLEPLLGDDLLPESKARILDKMWGKINALYLETWGRMTYSEEKEAIIRFVLKGVVER